jgi:hypothetical protein
MADKRPKQQYEFGEKTNGQENDSYKPAADAQLEQCGDAVCRPANKRQ